MLPLKRLLPFSLLALIAILSLSIAPPAQAYVDLAPTLAKIVTDSKQIALVEVEQYEPQSHTVVLKLVQTLKGDPITGSTRHQVTTTDGAPVPRPILQWAAPGAQAVLFASRTTSLVCIGETWYAARTAGATNAWRLAPERPDLPLAYCGTVSRLVEGVTLMLNGKDAIITTVPHGSEGESASFELALNRFNIPGLIKVQRLRTNITMSGPAMSTSASPIYVLGPGPVDAADLPQLVTKLASPEATVRAEAAEDLRSLGSKGTDAVAALNKLLADSTPRVRLSAASAVLRIMAKKGTQDTTALDVLSQGLASSDAAVRRDAAKATGLAGRLASPLVEKLAGLLKDSNPAVQISALQGIATLGPVAAKAVPAIVPLLSNPDLMMDAADAMGRIGPAARPIPPQLAKMVSSPEVSVQWAAVRAMSQIGGPESHPAVEYMIKALPKATEVDGYNTMVFLSLLGPDAKDAEEVIRNTRIKNPVLPSSTLWALAPEKYLPWQGGIGRGGPGGGFGGGGRGGPGGGGGFDIGSIIYESYIEEMGERLHAVSPILARKIMDGTAGTVPGYGYKLLAAGPKEALDVLVPFLANADRDQRERATVAIGFMGNAGIGAEAKLNEAAAKASDEREKRLIQWCIREINKD